MLRKRDQGGKRPGSRHYAAQARTGLRGPGLGCTTWDVAEPGTWHRGGAVAGAVRPEPPVRPGAPVRVGGVGGSLPAESTSPTALEGTLEGAAASRAAAQPIARR